MKLIPAAIVMILSITAGAFLAPMLSDQTAEESGQAPDKKDALVREFARKRAADRFAYWAKNDSETDPEVEKQALELLDVKNDDVMDLQGALVQTENAVQLAEEVAKNPDNLAERDVRYVGTRMIRDPLRIAKAFLESNDPAVRARGLEKLGTPLREGNLEAFELVALYYGDPDPAVSKAARDLALNTARRNGDKEAVRKAFEESGLVDQLVGAYAAEDNARTKKNLLRSLTSLKNPAAEQGWFDIYNGTEESARNKAEAARELRNLGRNGPYDTLLTSYAQGLSSTESGEIRTALRNISRLGGAEAIALLKAEVAANPDGENARQIERTLRRLERPTRRGRGGGGRGNRAN